MDEKVLSKLEELANYYKRRTKAVLPSAASMAKLIMQEEPAIEGTPPSDILENYNVLKDWQQAMETGQILPDAKLPETLPLGHYIPLQYDQKSLKADKKTIELAEKIVEISVTLERLIQQYNVWLASGCKDRAAFNKMAPEDPDRIGLHDDLETKIDALPYNEIVDKDALTEMACRFWVGVEIWKQKAEIGEATDEVKNHLDTVTNYIARRLGKTKNPSLDLTFQGNLAKKPKEQFNKEALAVIADPTKKIPPSAEDEVKDWVENLTEFVAAFKNQGSTPQVQTAAAGSYVPKP